MRQTGNKHRERHFHILVGSEPEGPLSEGDLRRLWNTREIGPQTYCWERGASDWMPIGQLDRFLDGSEPLASNSITEKKYSKTGRFAADGIANFAIGLVVICGWFLFMKTKNENGRKEVVSNRAPKSTGAVQQAVLSPIKTSEKSAIDSAKTLVFKRLKAPSTARFVEERIVHKEHPWYQIYITVDAQNSFGAQIRSGFLCTLKLEDDDDFTYSTEYGIQEANESDIRRDITLDVIRNLCGWPKINDPEKSK